MIEIVKNMLDSIEGISDFSESELYEHMTFKKMQTASILQMKQDLMRTFQDTESFGFLMGDERWQEVLQRNRL